MKDVFVITITDSVQTHEAAHIARGLLCQLRDVRVRSCQFECYLGVPGFSAARAALRMFGSP